MAILKIRKVSALPGTYEASTLYMVKSAEAGLFDMYLSTDDGSAVRHMLTKPEVQVLINNALAGFNAVQVVADIAARDALAPTVNTQVIVLDATTDVTVISGGATYIFDVATSIWHKISETESLDVVLQWSNIIGRPSSTVAELDDAVAKRHIHSNKSIIDDISDVGGQLAYAGQPVRAFLEEESW